MTEFPLVSTVLIVCGAMTIAILTHALRDVLARGPDMDRETEG